MSAGRPLTGRSLAAVRVGMPSQKRYLARAAGVLAQSCAPARVPRSFVRGSGAGATYGLLSMR